MADDFEQIGSFLSRWSRRKLDKTRPEAAPAESAPVEFTPAAIPESDAFGCAQTPATQAPPEAPLPPVASLTLDSDFSPFMGAKVDPGVKTAALKQLFKDPHFNVMDGLDTYIEDYSVPDPIPEAMMKSMYQAREHLFSDEEKAAADAADSVVAEKAVAEKAVEEKALAEAVDRMDAAQAEEDLALRRELEALDGTGQAGSPVIEATAADPSARATKDA